MRDNDPMLDAITKDGEIQVVGEETPQAGNTNDHSVASNEVQPSTEEIARETPEGSEEPKGEEPVVNEEPSGESENTQEDFVIPEQINQTIDEMSGGIFKSFEELRDSDLFERYQAYDESLEKIGQLEDEVGKDPFADPMIKAINDYVAEGGKDIGLFMELQSLNPSEMDDLEAVRAQMILQNPDLDDEKLEVYLKDKFHRYNSEDAEFDESQATKAEIALQMDAQKAREYLNSRKQDIQVPSREERESEYQQLEDQRIDSWTEPMDKAINSFDSIKIDLGSGEFEFQVPEEHLDALVEDMRNIIHTSGVELGDNGEDVARDIVRNHYIANNIDSIAKAISQRERSLAEEEWSKKVHNPSALKHEADPSSGEPENNGEASTESILAAIMNAENG